MKEHDLVKKKDEKMDEKLKNIELQSKKIEDETA